MFVYILPNTLTGLFNTTLGLCRALDHCRGTSVILCHLLLLQMALGAAPAGDLAKQQAAKRSDAGASSVSESPGHTYSGCDELGFVRCLVFVGVTIHVFYMGILIGFADDPTGGVYSCCQVVCCNGRWPCGSGCGQWF